LTLEGVYGEQPTAGILFLEIYLMGSSYAEKTPVQKPNIETFLQQKQYGMPDLGKP
jgi:hypothetical protein